MRFRTATPCARCGKIDRCSISLDGAIAICRTLPAWTDDDRVKLDRGGEEYVVISGGTVQEVPNCDDEERLASPDDLDAVYTSLRDFQREGRPLLDGHDRLALAKRGLDDATLTRLGYWSLVPGATSATLKLHTTHPGPIFRVPGIYERRMQRGIFVGGEAGLAIPVRDPKGRIVRLRLRSETLGSDGAPVRSYTWLSSPRSRDVTGVAATAVAHVPLHDRDVSTHEVLVTEGELKADIATWKLGRLVVSIPGVTMWGRALPVLRELGAQRVVLAFDADAREKPGVAGALQRFAGALAEDGFEVALATWDARYKGLDDVAVALGVDAIAVHEGADVAARIRELLASSGAVPDPLADAELELRAAVTAARDRPGAPFERQALLAAVLIRRERPSTWAEVTKLAQDQGAPRLREWKDNIERTARAESRAKREAETGPRPKRKRARVLVTDDERATADEALAIVVANEPDLYAANGALARVVQERVQDWTRTRIEPIPRDSLREIISRHVEFYIEREGKDGEVAETRSHPPQWCVNALYARGEWRDVRPLSGVVDAPVLRRDGTALDERGYDASTGYLYVPSRDFPRAPVDPSKEEGRAALALLDELISEFLFDATGPHENPEENRRMHLAGALALPLTLAARPYIRGPIPAFVVESPDSDSGKTNIVETLISAVTGSKPSGQRWNSDEDEWAKAYLAQIRDGTRVVFFDNVPTGGAFGHATLDAVLTQWPTWRGRILGQSQSVAIQNDAIIIATGNNLRVPNDTIRRVVRVRLRKRLTERRVWRYQLPDQAAELAPKLAIAAVTALRAYIVAGMPRCEAQLWGSYYAWSAIVPQCLAWYGYPDIRGTQEALRDAEESTVALGQVLRGWLVIDDNDEGLSAGRVLQLLSRRDLPPQELDALTMIREGIEGLDGRKKFPDHTVYSLGRLLAKYRGKVVGGLALEPSPRHGTDRRWHARRQDVIGTDELPRSAEALSTPDADEVDSDGFLR